MPRKTIGLVFTGFFIGRMEMETIIERKRMRERMTDRERKRGIK